MKVSHEVPCCLLTASDEFNDYSYCLPHLLDQNEEYRNYFYSVSAKGRYIVMDNSLHELGKAYDHKRLLYWIHKLKPDEFIVPDVWGDKTWTLVNAKYWSQFSYPSNTMLVAVVQAKNYIEAAECYTILKDLGYNKIAFSYGADWYMDEFPHPNKHISKALGRVAVITRLYKEGIIFKSDRIHLLGCELPQEFSWYKDMPFIESIDTSNPIMAALDNVKYTEYGLLEKPIANMNTHFDIDFLDIKFGWVLDNVNMFRKINGIKKLKINEIMIKNDLPYMMSLYEYLGKAAGKELGKEVCEIAIKLKETIKEKEISNPKYTGKVHLYRREFLDLYFKGKLHEDKETETSVGDS